MRVLNVHNRHAGPGGMEVLFEAITTLLRSRGDEVVVLERDNKSIGGLSGKLNAFGSMIYSRSARDEVRRILRDARPDVMHVHNLYPQLSPSILEAAREEGVPVVMSVQDFKLTCPTAQHLRGGEVCEKCLGGHEQWCAIHNCRGSRAMSVAYAVRNAWHRRRRTIHDGVAAFLCCSKFVADQHVRGGLPAERVHVLNNFCDLPDAPARTSPGEYVAYVGRISPEKGIPILIEAARRTGLPVKIAGDASAMPELLKDVPVNVEFVGRVSRGAMPEFLMRARMLAVPSIWYEAFGIVCAEAMAYRLPVIASRMGGLPEVVDDGVTGLTVKAGDASAWADALQRVWDDPESAMRMGEAGRQKAMIEYSSDIYYERLTGHYRRVIDRAGERKDVA